MGYHQQMVGQRTCAAGGTIYGETHGCKSAISLGQRVDGHKQVVKFAGMAHLVGTIVLVVAQAKEKLAVVHHAEHQALAQQLLSFAKRLNRWHGGDVYQVAGTIFRGVVAVQFVECGNQRLMQASHLAELRIGNLIDGTHVVGSSLFLERGEGALGVNHRVESVIGIVEEKERGIVARQLSGEKRPEGVGSTGDSLGIREHPVAHHLGLRAIHLIIDYYLHFLRSLGVFSSGRSA